MPPAAPLPLLVTRGAELSETARRFARHSRIAFDLESNGLFAYRACVCTVQLAAHGEVAIVDGLTAPLQALGPLLASPDVAKVVHDVAFDARLLAEAGISLANVLDTSVAARMLGRTSTGLATLLAEDLGLKLDKKMQHHDWAERPLTDVGLRYLAGDVIHLEALADRLWAQVEERGIAREVEEETRYRLAQAIASAKAPDPRPTYLRLKGIERVPADQLPILRRIAQVREEKARELGVPPYKVIAPDVLFAIAAAKPRTPAELDKIRGATQGRRARSLAGEMLRGVALGIEEGVIPAEDRALLERPRVPSSVARARRAREQRLTAWRKAEAGKREVDPQVVLPGHCLQDLADVALPSLDAIALVPGIGAFRFERDGAAILAALEGAPVAPSAPEETT